MYCHAKHGTDVLDVQSWYTTFLHDAGKLKLVARNPFMPDSLSVRKCYTVMDKIKLRLALDNPNYKQLVHTKCYIYFLS